MDHSSEAPPAAPPGRPESPLAGELLSTDAGRVAAFLESTPARRDALRRLRARIRREDLDAVMPDPAAAAALRVAVVARASASKARARRRALFAGATAVAGAVATALVVVLARVPTTRGPSVQSRTYATATGQRATLRLADGSRVVLAPRTTLVVPADFGTTARELSLRGEAYCDVRASRGAPFTVRTGDVSTRVLGTAFDVRRYDGRDPAQVVVVTGKVAVTAGRAARGVVLVAGTAGRAADSTVTVTPAGDGAPYTRWTSGQLVFRETPIPEALSTLQRWYGYEFRLSDSSLVVQHLSATFEAGRAAEMLNVLQAALDVTMTFDGNVVTLHPRAARRSGAGVRATPNPFNRDNTREVGR